MDQDRVLVAEISGKRPGDSNARRTERFLQNVTYDNLIISNDSEGYITDREIVHVPDDYKQWYIDNVKTSEKAWYAPMNRSYAIKYAKEHGYRYLVQLDDNIVKLEIAYLLENEDGTTKRCRITSDKDMMNDFIDMLTCVLKNTNAGMAGFPLCGVSIPSNDFLTERYCYSFFALDLERVPDIFQGDFEDDIEYRLKLSQMGVPVVQIAPLRYGKTAQAKSKGKKEDATGCRQGYIDAGVHRGDHMRILYGDLYTCGMRNRKNAITAARQDDDSLFFKHQLKPFKVGVRVKDMDEIKHTFHEILRKNYRQKEDKYVIKERKIRKK